MNEQIIIVTAVILTAVTAILGVVFRPRIKPTRRPAEPPSWKNDPKLFHLSPGLLKVHLNGMILDPWEDYIQVRSKISFSFDLRSGRGATRDVVMLTRGARQKIIFLDWNDPDWEEWIKIDK